MFLVNYSKDILYLVLAFCVLWLTFFLTWLVYYLISAARQLHKAAQIIKEQTEEVAGFVRKVKMAIEIPTSIIGLLLEGLKKITEYGFDTAEKVKKSQKSKKEKNGLDKAKKSSKIE
jgi:hypothetical protein